MDYVWDKGLLRKLNEPPPPGHWAGLNTCEAMLAAEAFLEPVDLTDPALRSALQHSHGLLIAMLMFGNAGLRIREAVGKREPWEREP